MAKLTARFPNFGESYVGGVMRAFVAELERAFERIQVDETSIRSSVSYADSPYSVTARDSLVECDTTSGNITVYLGIPTEDLIRQKFEANIKKSAEGNLLYITPTGGATTDFGTDTIVVRNLGTSLCFRAVTNGWRIV